MFGQEFLDRVSPIRLIEDLAVQFVQYEDRERLGRNGGGRIQFVITLAGSGRSCRLTLTRCRLEGCDRLHNAIFQNREIILREICNRLTIVIFYHRVQYD